jgi:predicted ATP-binding protein involved in virulence
MFLKRIKLTNIRSIKELDLSFTGADGAIRKWTLLLGENGCGKTSVLRSIALVVAGSRALPELLPRPEGWIRLGAKECAIEAELVTAKGEERTIALRWERGQHIREIFGQNQEAMDQLDAALEHSNRNYFLIGYGATRRLAGTRSSSPSREAFEHPRAQCVSTLFSNDAVLNPLDTWAMDLDYRRKEEGLDAVRAALKDLLPEVSLTRIDRDQRELIFATRDGELPLDQLSEGYQNMAAWCGDLLYRITEVYKDYKSPLSARGLLLIDEIDLHLHPVWQRVLREFLDRKLPHFQIFATTHSPLTAQQAGEGELFFLRRNDRKGGQAEVEPYPGAPNKLLLHQLLLSPAFGLTTLDSKKVEDMKGEYRSLKARKSTLPASGKRRLSELHDELVDLPEWTRPTKEDKKQVELLEQIQQALKNGPGASPKRSGRKRRV